MRRVRGTAGSESRSRPEEAARRLPHVVSLVSAWTNGDRREATEDTCDLAIMLVDMIEESMISGAPCMSLLPPLDTSFAARAAANGMKVEPLPKAG